MTRTHYLLGCSLIILAALGFAVSGEAGKNKPADKDAGKKSPAATYKVEKGPLKVEVTLKGVFEAESMTPFQLSLEGWTKHNGGPLAVHKAVEHGSTVHKGDTLLWLDLERVDHQIRDLEAEQHNEEVSISLAEKELPLAERAAPAELAAVEHAKKVADEDLQEYLSKGRAYSEKSSEFFLKNTRDMLENAQDELKQLEKMYKANDLTEETEQIVLKRQRREVEFFTFFVKMSEYRHEDLVRYTLPRRDRSLRDQAEHQTLALEKLRQTQTLHLTQKRLALDKLKHDRAKTTERLGKLKRDRELLACRAPADGIVYYGRCVHGHWTTGSQMAERLLRGGEVQPEEVVFTIVQPQNLFVRADVEEKDLHHLKAGQAVKVEPTANAEIKLDGKLDTVSAVPLSAGKFLARVKVDLPKTGSPWMPGMACSIKVVPYRKADALTLPSSAVFTDDLDDDRHYVYLPSEARRDIKLGQKSGQRVEILQGLRSGDEVLQQKPGDGTTAAGKKEEK